MKNKRRTLAIIGIIFLLALFALTLFFALFDPTESLIYLKTCIAASLFFPVMIYVVLLLSKNSRYTGDDEDDDSIA